MRLQQTAPFQPSLPRLYVDRSTAGPVWPGVICNSRPPSSPPLIPFSSTVDRARNPSRVLKPMMGGTISFPSSADRDN